MTETIYGTINHQSINKLVRQYRGQLSGPIQANLRQLRNGIDKALDGESNVRVYIYISDELDEPICHQTGDGENELLIDVEPTGIEYTWTKKTFWKKAKEFFSDVAHKIVDGLRSIWSSVLSIGSTAMQALTFF